MPLTTRTMIVRGRGARGAVFPAFIADIDNPQDGDILIYDDELGKWKNSAILTRIIPRVAVVATAFDMGTELAWDIVIPEGNNRRLFVVIANSGSPSPTDVTSETIASTLIQGHFTANVEFKLYDCGSPPVGTVDLVGVFSGSAPIAGIAFSFVDVENTIGSPVGIHSYDRLSLTSHHRSVAITSGGNDVVFTTGIASAIDDAVPDAPAVKVSTVNLPGDVGELFLLTQPATWPGLETVAGFTFPLSATGCGEAVSLIGR